MPTSNHSFYAIVTLNRHFQSSYTSAFIYLRYQTATKADFLFFILFPSSITFYFSFCLFLIFFLRLLPSSSSFLSLVIYFIIPFSKMVADPPFFQVHSAPVHLHSPREINVSSEHEFPFLSGRLRGKLLIVPPRHRVQKRRDSLLRQALRIILNFRPGVTFSIVFL